MPNNDDLIGNPIFDALLRFKMECESAWRCEDRLYALDEPSIQQSQTRAAFDDVAKEIRRVAELEERLKAVMECSTKGGEASPASVKWVIDLYGIDQACVVLSGILNVDIGEADAAREKTEEDLEIAREKRLVLAKAFTTFVEAVEHECEAHDPEAIKRKDCALCKALETARHAITETDLIEQ